MNCVPHERTFLEAIALAALIFLQIVKREYETCRQLAPSG